MLLIRAGKIKPIVGEEMENGELLIGDDGKIAAIGQKVDAPEGVEVLDASGCLVTRTAISASTKRAFAGRATTPTNIPAPSRPSCGPLTASIPGARLLPTRWRVV